ncbi:MAG TPA: 2-oxoglutarate dehydrogenase, E2 component, dihydrolipoamide succinyltransferase [Terriglobia bacterium]|nr:2-oxoglutarate dehydrogenase, E2 component, dihydrolipoamide succinyltransferase [Terriglobia bacterium]
MPTNVIMPQMGESIAEGTVTRWLKKVGERVERDEPLFEISTDKVDAEIPSPAAGILTKILVSENQTVEVNAVVAEIDGERPATQPVASEVRHNAAPEEAALVGTIAPPAPVSGPDGSVAPPFSVPSEPAASGSTADAAGAALASQHVRSSPLVRRLAKENHVDLSRVKGTGLGGRISKKDILAHLATQPAVAGAQPSVAAGAVAPPSAVVSDSTAPAARQVVFTGPTQAVPMTPIRKQIAEHMVLSRRTSAHVTTVFEVEMTRVFDIRAQQAAEFERRNGLKLTFTPFIVRGAVEAIKQHPIFNASVEGDKIIYKRDVNIGVAVALETGLIVPVVKRADEKNFLGVARAVTDLAERARSKRLNVDEVQGGTFTITNPGVFGSLFGTPIINQPQVAILGVGVIEKRAVVRNDAIAIRPMAYLALSFDHRIIDGAVADQFMVKIKMVLENWTEAVF